MSYHGYKIPLCMIRSARFHSLSYPGCQIPLSILTWMSDSTLYLNLDVRFHSLSYPGYKIRLCIFLGARFHSLSYPACQIPFSILS